MKIAFKIAVSLPILFITIALLLVNLRLTNPKSITPTQPNTADATLLKELRGLANALHHDADVEMQALYPEGYVFINAMYGLAWCNVLARLDNNSALYEEGHAALAQAWRKIDSDLARAIFDENLPLAYGSFYTGWSTYLLGKKLRVESKQRRDNGELSYFRQRCDSIAVAIQRNIYPPSYSGRAWPADVAMCVASLRLHDNLFEPRYAAVISGWIERVKQKVDQHGLIPHAARPSNGTSRIDARGSSQSLMLIFLKDIDPAFANAQFELYREAFPDEILGLTGIREYRKGVFGVGDVDSGPVVLNMGPAASIVGAYTLHCFGEHTSSARLLAEIEAFGFAHETHEQKTHLLGALPMADAFIAWVHSGVATTKPVDVSFTKFRLSCFGAVLILASLFWWVWMPAEYSSERSLHIPW